MNNKILSNTDFILKYNKFEENKIKDINLLDQRRVIFISLIGLYTTWKNCPSIILYSAIFLLPLNQKWIYNPTKYKKDIQNSFFGQYTPFYQGKYIPNYVYYIYCIQFIISRRIIST